MTWRIACHGRRERAPLLTMARPGPVPGRGDRGRAHDGGRVGRSPASSPAGATPLLLALTTGTASLAAQLTLLPFFCRFRNHPPLAGPVERRAQWALLLAVTVAVFVPTDFPLLVLLVLPVLAWGALRNGSYESLAQMAVAVGISLPITTCGSRPVRPAGPEVRRTRRPAGHPARDLRHRVRAGRAGAAADGRRAARERAPGGRRARPDAQRRRRHHQRRDHRRRPRGPDHAVQPGRPAAARATTPRRCSASPRGCCTPTAASPRRPRSSASPTTSRRWPGR